MGMNPWLADELVARRRRELEESARSARRGGRDGAELGATHPAAPLPKRASQRLGGLLIALGCRLAGPDGWTKALDV